MNSRKKLLCATFACGLALPLFAADKALQDLKTADAADFDQRFLRHMIEHHQQAVEMAHVAEQRAKTDEVKRFAEKTAHEQQQEIARMETMLGTKRTELPAARAGSDVSMGRAAPTTSATEANARAKQNKVEDIERADQDDADEQQKMMSALTAAHGAEFDHAFVEQMIKHHASGAEMARLAERRAASEDVRDFAAETAGKQQKEIEQLKHLQGAATE